MSSNTTHSTASELAKAFIAELLAELKKGTLILPTLPDVVVRIRQAINNPEIALKEIVQVIGSDPAISARLVLIANSSLMRGSKRVETVERAVNRLGLKMVRDVVTAIVIEQLFEPKHPATARRLRAVWEHSTAVAAISYMVASRYTPHLSAEEALLAGLIHDIGTLPILTHAEQHPQLLKDERILEAVIRKYHTYLGRVILTAWDFPERITIAVAEHEILDRESREGRRADLTDVVIVANLQSYIGTAHPLMQQNWSGVTAFGRTGIDPNSNLLDTADLNEVVDEAKSLLRHRE
ncbi:HDOD domain-containing protein [Ectothiorhodospiraceae bacterium BW-2]|nr:HDOD domain-containing protein [Ectothiorhodospiraceae bacterium BW-2]